MKKSMRIALASLVGLTAVAEQGITVPASLDSPGFEIGPDEDVVAFTPNDSDGLLWKASNTDGERYRSTKGREAAEGEFYAALLQNGGSYDGSPLGIGDFGFTGFDRIYAVFSVQPSTTYQVSFEHAGDNRFGYTAGTTVVEIVDADSNATLALEMIPTPGLFEWERGLVTFSSGISTTNAAVALTVMGAGNASGIFDDVQVLPAIFTDGFESGNTSAWSSTVD